MTKDEFRVLTAVEMGMRNHEVVPVPLIESIARLNRGGTYKIISNLLRHKLIAHEKAGYDGYRLTYNGFDFLALRALAARGTIIGVGRRLGVGKESDVHFCQGPNNEQYALKLHRLGRVSFRAIKRTRDYLQHRTHGSWMYMARLAATKEFAYMKALYDEGFPVPTPVDQNRHCVVMSLIDAVPMYSIRDLPRPQVVLERLMRLLIRLGRSGIVHGDFNEFNLMIGPDQKVTVIDFPQIVHLNHFNAREYFDRDVKCICDYFLKKCDLEVERYPSFDEVLAEVEADGGGVLSSLNVQGMNRDEDALLVAAHGSADDSARVNMPPSRLDDENEDEEEGSDSEIEEQEAEADTEDFAALLPEGGHCELVEPEEEIDEEALHSSTLEEAINEADTAPLNIRPAPTPSRNKAEDAAAKSDDEDSDDGETSEASDAPGQVAVPAARKTNTRKKQSAKEARKNLQKQQKTRPAKANNQKVRELRNAKHQVKEYLS
jgi:RIO kinase 2